MDFKVEFHFSEGQVYWYPSYPANLWNDLKAALHHGTEFNLNQREWGALGVAYFKGPAPSFTESDRFPPP